MYASLMGYEAKGVEPIVEVVKQRPTDRLAAKSRRRPTRFAPASGPTPIFTTRWASRRLKFGLGGKKYAIRSEQIDIEEIYVGAQVYALAGAEICNWEK